MRRNVRMRSATLRPACRSAFALILLLSFVPAAAAQSGKRAAAHAQFVKAGKMRTALEGLPQKKRPLEDYARLIAAYRKVYLITPAAPDVTAALAAAA